MRLVLFLTICLQLNLLLAAAQAGGIEEVTAAQVVQEADRQRFDEVLDWRRRGDEVQQILTEPKYDFDNVGYRIGSLEAVTDAIKTWSPASDASVEDVESEMGFGSDTLNWVHGVSCTEDNRSTVSTESNDVEQAEFEESVLPAPLPQSQFDPIGIDPYQVFSAPMDPLVRQYVPAPVIPAETKPLVKSLWREYADWAHDGFVTWTERLELGGSFLEGNTNQEAFNTAARFSRDTEFITTQINIGGSHAQSKKTVTQNRWHADTTTDFKRKGNWLYFVRSLHEYDQFTNLDYRGTASFGMGYRFFNEENRKLIVRYGPGVTQEIFHSPRVVRTSPDLFGEFEAKWPIGPRIIFEEKATFHPNITNFGMLRVLNTTGFLIPLDDQKRWNLKVGFRFEYNGRPNANRQPSDFATNVNIVYSRK